MRLVSLGGLICVLSLLLLTCASALETYSLTVPQKFYDATDIPQVYTYVLRQLAGQTQTLVTFQSGTSSFESITTNAAYRIGTLTLTHYKLLREPISKFSLAKRTYEYITLESNTTISVSDGVTGQISFHVDKSWVDAAGAQPEQMALFVFDADSSSWEKLDTRLVNTVGSEYEYTAYTSLFGYFAIALDRPLQGPSTTSPAATTSGSSGTGSQSTSTNSGTATTDVPLDSGSSDSSEQDTQSVPVSNAPQVVDSSSQPTDVVYPLLDDSNPAATTSGVSLQKIIGYALIFFAVSGVAIIGITVTQSRSNKPAQFRQGASVNELLAQLQASRALKVPKSPPVTSDINALLQKVHARYQPTFSLPKSSNLPSMSSFSSGTSAFANSLTHSIDELKEKVSQLEPDLIKRYTDWGMSHGHNLAMIKQDLISHDIDESAINRVLSQQWKKF